MTDKQNPQKSEGFEVEKTELAWTFTLARPEAKNALNEKVIAGLEAMLEAAKAQFEDASTPRVLVLRAQGEHFCAGGDVREMMSARAHENPKAKITAISERFGALCLAMRNHPLVIVGVVEGPALGGGFGLACACDLLIASNDANFQLPETKLGLVPSQIAPYLVDRIGRRAMSLALTGRKLGAKEALSIGLVDVLAEDTVDTEVDALVQSICARAPKATSQTKARFSTEISTHYARDAAEEFARAALGAEAAEGVRALLEKRRAKWIK